MSERLSEQRLAEIRDWSGGRTSDHAHAMNDLLAELAALRAERDVLARTVASLQDALQEVGADL